MALKVMYRGTNNSPMTSLVGGLSATETIVNVSDAGKLPPAPNLATLGMDEDAEVIQYTGKEGNTLTGVIRGFGGTVARIWPEGTEVYRAYTQYDHDTFKENIEAMETSKLEETGDGTALTATFTQSPAGPANIASGEALGTIFGKIRKWFASFGTAAWKGVGTGAEDVAAGRHAGQHAADGEDPLSLDAMYAYPGKLPWSPDDYKAFRNVYVYTTGDDGNDGLSAAAPMRTIEAAFRKYLSTYPLTIRLNAGTHAIGTLSVSAAPFIQIVGAGTATTIIEGSITITGGSLQINSATLRNTTSAIVIGSLAKIFLNSVTLDGVNKTNAAMNLSTCFVRLNDCRFTNNLSCIISAYASLVGTNLVKIEDTNTQGLYAASGIILWGTDTATHYNKASTAMAFSRGGAISVGGQWRTQ